MQKYFIEGRVISLEQFSNNLWHRILRVESPERLIPAEVTGIDIGVFGEEIIGNQNQTNRGIRFIQIDTYNIFVPPSTPEHYKYQGLSSFLEVQRGAPRVHSKGAYFLSDKGESPK